MEYISAREGAIMRHSTLKKIIALALIFIMILSLGGCKYFIKEEEVSSVPATPEPPKTSKIGLLQYDDHMALDHIRETFIARVEEWGYDENTVTIDYKNAQGDDEKLKEICEQYKTSGVDMIVAISTPAAKAAIEAAKDTDIKVVFSAVSDPEKDLGISPSQSPSGNITGTSDTASWKETVNLAVESNKGAKKFGILRSDKEESIKKTAEDIKKHLAEYEGREFEVVEAVVNSPEEIETKLNELCDSVDVIYSMSDNMIASSIDKIVSITRERKKPFFAGADSTLVQQGALACVGIDLTELALKTADMTVEIIAGKKISAVPIVEFKADVTYINQTTLEAVGAKFTDEIMQQAIFFEDEKPKTEQAEPSNENSETGEEVA